MQDDDWSSVCCLIKIKVNLNTLNPFKP
jgi:hypothetical protein